MPDRYQVADAIMFTAVVVAIAGAAFGDAEPIAAGVGLAVVAYVLRAEGQK